jgi:dihydrofolate synthase/folylpolyglutamate synthase
MLNRLYSLQRFGMKLGLDNIENLLEIVGNPHEGAKGVHIAGTNGKGSVAAMLTSMLMSAGYRVATYTSPHLVDFEERMMINREPIEKDELLEYIKRYLEIRESMEKEEDKSTFFEITTAMAFEYFRKRGADVWVIETGMGGRLDATNTVRFKTGVITRIGMDHTEHLGKTRDKIAMEKAGIIKEGMNVVTAESGDTLKVIEKKAKEVGANLFSLDRDFHVEVLRSNINGVEAKVDGIYDEYHLNIPLIGRHQAENAALSVVAAELMRHDDIYVEKSAIISGMASTVWKGRFEILSKNPLVIVDAAHNTDGAIALRRALMDAGLWGKYTLVLGMLKDKDAEGFSSILMKGAEKTIITEPEYRPRAMKMEELMKISSKYGSVEGERNPVDAVKKAISYGNPVVVTGSIYLLGDVLSEMEFNKVE